MMDEGLLASLVSAVLGGGLFTGVLEIVRYVRKEPVERHTAIVSSLDTANSALDRTVETLVERLEDLEADVKELKEDRAEDRGYIIRVVPVVDEYVPAELRPAVPKWYNRH